MRYLNGLVLLSFLGIAACSKGAGDKTPLARQGSVEITAGEFEKELASAPPLYQKYLSTVEGKKEFLDMILKEKVLLDEAKKAGVANRPEVKKRLEEFKENVKREEEQFRDNLLVRELLKDLQESELKITEEDMRGYYKENEARFKDPVRVEANHILVSTEEEAKKVLERLKKNEDFKKVAREVSKDPSALQGGFIGQVEQGFLPDMPEFEQALFSLKAGELSNIVKTRLGYHVIKRGSSTKLEPKDFEKAAPEIRRLLEKKKFDSWLAKKREGDKNWVNEELLSKLPKQIKEEAPEPALASTEELPQKEVSR